MGSGSCCCNQSHFQFQYAFQKVGVLFCVCDDLVSLYLLIWISLQDLIIDLLDLIIRRALFLKSFPPLCLWRSGGTRKEGDDTDCVPSTTVSVPVPLLLSYVIYSPFFGSIVILALIGVHVSDHYSIYFSFAEIFGSHCILNHYFHRLPVYLKMYPEQLTTSDENGTLCRGFTLLTFEIA